ncbi:hypothetical protein [Desulfosediminicola flagellatus]|uniref:hypothetical protein n=1 Tax=Desulfosediminicola flagellatus TaxID=2569541 RepID=UPI0030846CE2
MVPGQVQHDSACKAVLSRADGVSFVADSQNDQSINNSELFQNVAVNEARVGLDFQKLPLVVQFNKRDLTNILSREEIMSRWGLAPWPVVFSVAITGPGVMETFRQVLLQVFTDIEKDYNLAEEHGVSSDDFLTGIMGDVSFAETDR